MLRTSHIRKARVQSYICWSCCAKVHSPSNGTSARGLRGTESTPSDVRQHIPQSLARRPSRRFIVGIRNQAAEAQLYSDFGPRSDFQHAFSGRDVSDIRAKLRTWESENEHKFVPSPELADHVTPGHVRNNFTRMTAGEFEVEDDTVGWNAEKRDSSLDQDDRLDIGSKRGFLIPGDLVELLGVGTRERELAIFVREFENQAQYYTMSGKWLNRSSKQVKFFVPHFVESTELNEILPYLPQTDVSGSLQDKLNPLDKSAPREIGKPLVNKMVKFWKESESAYQAAALKLDNAHQFIALQDEYRYATLDEIATDLIGDSGKPQKDQDGRYSQPVLYAVHRSLTRDDIGIQCHMRGGHRAGSLYEVNSLSEVRNVVNVTTFVRRYQEEKVARRSSVAAEGSSILEHFAVKARKLIDSSRRARQFTPFGSIGPSSVQAQGPDCFDGLEVAQFDAHEQCFIRFLESWAGLRSFNLHSSLNGIGSAILRATDRYDNEGLLLDQSTAWTFLQEIGSIPPWENPAAYLLRIPGVGKRLQKKRRGREIYREDILQKIRKDWGSMPVYCIDDPTAHELDDGVSVEKTDVPEEFWVHIHTADPSSTMDPESDIARVAQNRAQSIYLPEMVVSMLYDQYVQSNLSLKRNRPSLTFSARMNKGGDILETKVTPGTVRQVVYLSPKILGEIVEGPSPMLQKTVIAIGQDMPTFVPTRKMAEVDDLLDLDKENLRLLNMIGKAHAAKRAERGGLSFKQNDNSISVSFKGSPWKPQQGSGSYSYSADPSIQLVIDKDDVSSSGGSKVETVQNLMLLAGEIAAHWSYERGIPIPYRITPLNSSLPNPGDYFRDTVLPSLDSDGHAPEEVARQYHRLCGQVLSSSTPGPHVTIGLDMYARCTSPLRRYGDLLVHWQVGAALLEEERTGRSLVGNTREDFLPFTKAHLDEILPRMAITERLHSVGMAFAERTWLCKLLFRAWHFQEATLPATFEYVVKHITRLGVLHGHLPYFLEDAVCNKPNLDVIGDIKVGDVLQVELDHIDAYRGSIEVKALRRTNPLT